MKLTDLSLIYIAVLLPIIIVVYVNVSFTIKAQEQEIYYQNLIDSAVYDATNQMKEIENEDTSIDYGYSGVDNSKVSVNAQIGVDTFLDNLYNNFNVKGNDSAERLLQLYVPAISLIDYDGIIVSSVETYTSNGTTITEHRLKPKSYYTYTYTIVKDKSSSSGYKIVDGYSNDSNAVSWHLVEFTMDDYITHRGSYKDAGQIKDYDVKSFYITDEQIASGSDSNKKNNADLGDDDILQDVEQKLQEIRKDIIVNKVVKELTYAVNKNNSYARNAGITYTFSFPTTSTEDMYATINNIGFLAFVQGINVGNKYLNTKAYSVTSLELSTRYYFSVYCNGSASKYEYNLYHRDINCPEYIASFVDKTDSTKALIDKITPRYVLSKQEAASSQVKVKYANSGGGESLYQGFYPCPICNP
jgi:hypothetical protein